jgi:type IX secretion system PorP/SprF family membrane protein
MKKYLHLVFLLLIPTRLYSQQFPFMEGYNMNPFNMSPAFAGIHNPRTLFVDYRADWVGVSGGPVTYQLSYNDRIFEKVGIGARFIYDKTDIFKQTMLLGTYTYEVKILEEHIVNLGLSVGFFRNSIDLAKYYNNPDFVLDNILIYGLQKSKIKFATDFSALYRFHDFEGGILFSNVMFGSAKYNSSDIAYKPTKNFLFHVAYDYKINKTWAVKPFVLLRGGKHYPIQLELASEIMFINKFWGTAVFRTGGIWGMGLGGEIYNGILINYSYNLSTNVALNTFGSHQITLGVRLYDLKDTKSISRSK